MTSLVYTGIGSRRAPKSALDLAGRLAFCLTHHGLTLRTGGAEGMDTAFEEGCRARMADTKAIRRTGLLEVFRPEDSQRWCHEEVKRHLDPGVSLQDMSPFVAGLLARNMQQVLGHDGKVPSMFVLYWTPTPDGTSLRAGGTRYAVRCAKAHGIPTLNLLDTTFEAALDWASDHVS